MTGLGLFEGKGQVDTLIACFRCGIYCADHQVNLSLTEGLRIADRLELTPDEFQNRYTGKRLPLRVSPAGSADGTPERVPELYRLLESLVTGNSQDLN